MARRVILRNATVIRLKFDSVNAPPPAHLQIGSKETSEFDDARPQYGGVSYIAEGNTQPSSKWIVAWKVAANKVFSKVIQGNQAVNWKDINEELEEYGKATYSCPDVLGLKSDVKIEQSGTTKITASLSKVQP